MWHQWFNLNIIKLREYFFGCKENKNKEFGIRRAQSWTGGEGVMLFPLGWGYHNSRFYHNSFSCWFLSFAICLSITTNLSQTNFPIIKTKHFKVTKYKNKYGRYLGQSGYLGTRSAMVFLMITESQELGLMSHPKDGAFYSIDSPSLHWGVRTHTDHRVSTPFWSH